VADPGLRRSDRTFITLPASKEKEETGGGSTEPKTIGGTEPTTGGSSSGSVASGGGSSAGTNLVTSSVSSAGTNPVVSEKAIEKVLLGCSTRPLALNDVVEKGGKVLLIGAAERAQAGKQVKIVFGSDKVVATARVGSSGEFSTTAPLPPVKIRGGNGARYIAELGSLRSLDLKLTRRLALEPPSVYRLTSSVAQSRGSGHSFATFSLPLPAVFGPPADGDWDSSGSSRRECRQMAPGAPLALIGSALAS
jgi:hypothetical protein